MRVTHGTVVSGQVVLDDPSPDELAELEAGIAEADRGETISGDEFFARLRRFEGTLPTI